jgi:acyl carrier protein
MKKKDLLIHLAKIFEKKSITENDTFKNLDFDSLIGLDLTTFNDENFSSLNIEYESIQKCKTIKDLIKLYGNKID